MTQPARPDPARNPSRNDNVRPGPAPPGVCGPAQSSVSALALHIVTRPPRRTRPAQGGSGPPAAHRAHHAGSWT